MSPRAHAFEIEQVEAPLAAGNGYEIVHSSPGLEIGVYVLVAPEPDRQQPHDDDEVYVVLEGTGVLTSRATRSRSHEGRRSSCPRTPSTSSPPTRA